MDAHDHLPLHTVKPMPQTLFNRIFALIYGCAILFLLYYHATSLFFSKNLVSFFITITILISDLVLTFMWINTQALRMYPVYRQQYPENLKKMMKRSNYPNLDVFICTADPYKEPPISVVNSALSVMAYDYPTEKISVYVSDDGGSALTLFALMEAAKFATHWLPFCKENNVIERSPEAYFESGQPYSSETQKIKVLYESMKFRIEHNLERGKVDDQYIDEEEQKAFDKWTDKFRRQDHPTIIQILLDSSKDRDITECQMPNFIYVSREKSKNSQHHFKAGALNVLLRVSATMTNAPIILTLDCDMYSHDPETPLNALCYLLDPNLRFVSKLGYVQFPQRFHTTNKNDIYASGHRRLFDLHPIGFDGLKGPNYVGTGCFFARRVFFGSPLAMVNPEIPELGPNHVVDKPLQSQSILTLAHQVSNCHYENQTAWGSKIGFKYGSLVEDYYTGYRLKCEGWFSVFCNPKRAAFLGDTPHSLIDLLNQQKRWSVGLLEVAFSKYSTLTFGVRAIGPLMGLGYSLLAFWPSWSIPICTYAFLPQLALLHQVYIFPKASELPWFLLYIFLFIGAYGQDFLDFASIGVTFKCWWNDQRIWHVRGLTCYLYGSIEFLLHTFGFSKFGFNITSKVIDEEMSKRFGHGIFTFGVHSPMFVTLTMATLVNLAALVKGLIDVWRGRNLDEPCLQLLVAGFAVLNSWPIYEAIFFRSDSGKMPVRTTFMATFFGCCLCLVAYFIQKCKIKLIV